MRFKPFKHTVAKRSAVVKPNLGLPPAASGRSAQQLFIAQLAARAEDLAHKGLADSTNDNYSRAQRYFLEFVAYTAEAFGSTMDEVLADPASARHLVVLFAALKAETCNAASVRVYLAAIRTLFLSRELPNPCENNYKLGQLLKGLRRLKGDGGRRKLPITHELLRAFASQVDPSSPTDVAFMSASLIAFFTFARKANVTTKRDSLKEDDIVLRRCDVEVDLDRWALYVTFRRTKTIQFGERTLRLPIYGMRGHCIDPVAWYLHHISVSPASPSAHAFAHCPARGRPLRNLTHAVFVARTKESIRRAGIDPSKYSGHSYRRGGASLLFEATSNENLLKALGDWRSTAYQLYMSVSSALKAKGAAALSARVFGTAS